MIKKRGAHLAISGAIVASEQTGGEQTILSLPGVHGFSSETLTGH